MSIELTVNGRIANTDIVHVLIDGRSVFDNGVLTTIDVHAAIAEMDVIAKEVRATSGLSVD